MRRLALALVATAALALAGCSRKEPAPQEEPALNTPEPVVPAPAPPPPPPAPPKAAPPVERNDSAVEDAEPDRSEQTQEDADAVGMTTHAPPPADFQDMPINNADVSGEQ